MASLSEFDEVDIINELLAFIREKRVFSKQEKEQLSRISQKVPKVDFFFQIALDREPTTGIALFFSIALFHTILS